jgi:uncharacterized membrane protein YfcA
MVLAVLLFFGVAFVAAAVASIAGFGTATMTIPFLAWIVGIKQAIILVAFFHGFSNLFKLGSLRRNLDWRLFLLYGIPSVITAVIGAYLLDVVAPGDVGLGVGIFLIIFAVFSCVRPGWKMPQNMVTLVSGGLLSGFTAGLIGLGGAIRGAFLVSTHLRKEAYIATSAAIALGTDIARCVTYVANGSLDAKYWWYLPVLFVVGLLGTRLGVRMLRFLPETVVRRVVLMALILVSLFFIFNYLGWIDVAG